MAYFLRKENRKNGIYLQMYENYWDKKLKQGRSKHIRSFGFVHDLVSDDIPNPIAHYTEVVKQMEIERQKLLNDDTRPRAFRERVEKNVGYFLVRSLISELDVKEVIDILASVCKFRFRVYDLLTQLIYSRIIYPCSKSKTVAEVFPLLYRNSLISEDQVYDGLYFIGGSYKKYIELFNKQYEQFYKRDYSRAYFDCTNYYFEIDLPKDDKQKGPSKENRHTPIIGQALLLDSDLVPFGMEMYPGNESEKPYIRKIIEEMKQRYNVSGKTVQVADKGLNCARNIYAAVVEANDGYIFSKSVKGRCLSQKEKEWVLLENSANVFTDYTDANGNILYRLKSCVDTFDYSFEEIDPDTGEIIKTAFKVKEKRLVSYNPGLARKQQAEIKKMVDKALRCATYKQLAKEEIGDASKYLKVTSKDKSGRKVKPVIEIDTSKVEEDMKMAGYNLMITSEVEMPSKQIYDTYHALWKIEESFRITKSYLDARPAYVQKQETIYGHFLVCYLSLFLLRVLEIKCFKNKVNAYDIIEFIRDFRVAKKDGNTYINLSCKRNTNEKIKAVTGITVLDALYLTEQELDNLFDSTILINS
jgi:transposase